MKIIYLVRHAKAEQKSTEDKDFDRVLTAKGISDATAVGKWLKGKKILPELFITSPAKRALQTAEIVRNIIGYTPELTLDKNIYTDTADDLIEIIRNTSEKVFSIMLAGHNPSFNELLHYLCKTEIDNIPKASAVAIMITGTWKDMAKGCGVVVFMEKPR